MGSHVQRAISEGAAMTKKEWLRNFANTETWYSKDLKAALAEWDQLEAENIALKEAINNLRADIKVQNEGIRDLQMQVCALKAEIDEYEDMRIKACDD